MASKDVNIKVKAKDEASGPLQQILKKVNSLGKNQTLNSIKNLGLAFTGAVGTIRAVTSAVSKLGQSVMECTELYRQQAKAELALESAANANPFLNKSAVNKLKDYASHLQSISNIGDESLLPMMAELAASGRDQETIMKIMSAALDVSSSGLVDMGTAVRSLNQSLDGSVGSLGKVLPQLKNISKEELASGAAIDMVGKSFEGLAEKTAESLNSTQRLSNAWGDFKEALGRKFNVVVAPLQNVATGIVTSLTDAVNEAEDLEQRAAAIAADLKLVGLTSKEIEKARKAAEKKTAKEEAAAQKAALKQMKEDAAVTMKALRDTYNINKENFKQSLGQMGNNNSTFWQNALKSPEAWNKAVIAMERDVVNQFMDADQVFGRGSLINDDAYQKAIEAGNAELANSISLKKEREAIDWIMNSVIQKYGIERDMVEKILISEGKVTKEQFQQWENAKIKVASRKQQAEAAAEAFRQEQKTNEALEQQRKTRTAILQKSTDNYDSIMKRYRDTLKQAELEAELKGEQVSLQTKLNAATEAYIAMSLDGNLIKKSKEMKQVVIELAAAYKDVEDAENAVKEATKKIDEQTKGLDDSINDLLNPSEESGSLVDLLENTIALLEENKQKYLGNAEAVKKFNNEIDRLTELLPKVAEAELLKKADEFEKVLDKINEKELTEIEQLERQKADIERQYAELSANSQVNLAEKKREALDRIEEQITQKQKEEQDKRKEETRKLVSDCMDLFNQMCTAVQQTSQLLMTMVTNQYDAQAAELDAMHEREEISDEEYSEKKRELAEKEADDLYKLQMIAWSMDLAMAICNTAMAATKSLADYGAPLGIAFAAMALAMGGIQVGTLIANKPQKQTFSTGGYIKSSGGGNYHGDNVEISAFANEGELILTPAQQRNMLALANGEGGNSSGGGNVDMMVSVYNNVADKANVSVEQDRRRLNVIIDAAVREGMEAGKYLKSQAIADQLSTGIFYG